MMHAVDELGPQHLLFFLIIRWNTEGAVHPMEAIVLMYSWMLAPIITFKLSVAHMVWRCWIWDGILCIYCTFCLEINHTCLLLRLQTEQAPQYLSYHFLPFVLGGCTHFSSVLAPFCTRVRWAFSFFASNLYWGHSLHALHLTLLYIFRFIAQWLPWYFSCTNNSTDGTENTRWSHIRTNRCFIIFALVNVLRNSSLFNPTVSENLS